MAICDAARGWQEEAKLLAADGERGDDFGSSVAVSGDVAFIGAAGDTVDGTRSGSVYVFRFDPQSSGWQEQDRLAPPDGVDFGSFGQSVALDGPTVVIGALADDDDRSVSGTA